LSRDEYLNSSSSATEYLFRCYVGSRHFRPGSGVAVEGDERAAVLDGKRGEPRVGHARAPRAGLPAQVAKDAPVPLAGFNDAAMRLPQKVFATTQTHPQASWTAEGVDDTGLVQGWAATRGVALCSYFVLDSLSR